MTWEVGQEVFLEMNPGCGADCHSTITKIANGRAYFGKGAYSYFDVENGAINGGLFSAGRAWASKDERDASEERSLVMRRLGNVLVFYPPTHLSTQRLQQILEEIRGPKETGL